MSRQVTGRRMHVVGHRTRRTMAVAVLAGVATAVTATPAAAGGWWSTPQLEHQTLAIGESTTVSVGVMFSSTEEADEVVGSGEYFAYLVRDIDEAGLHDAMSRSGPDGDWWTTPDEAIELGPLTLGRNMSNLGNAKATFVVPEVEPGIYDVMLCDRGCSRALADVVPLRDVYVGDPVTVRFLREAGLETQYLLDQFGSMQSQLERLDDQTGTLSDQTGTLSDTIDDLGRRFEDQTTTGHRLTASLATLESRLGEGGQQGSVATPWWAQAGWFVAGAAVAIAWMRRRHGRTMDEPGDDRGRADDRDRRPANFDDDEEQSSPPELVTWEMR